MIAFYYFELLEKRQRYIIKINYSIQMHTYLKSESLYISLLHVKILFGN